MVQNAVTDSLSRKYLLFLMNRSRSTGNDFPAARKSHKAVVEQTYLSQTWKINEKSSLIQAMEMGVRAQKRSMAVTGTRVTNLLLFITTSLNRQDIQSSVFV